MKARGASRSRRLVQIAASVFAVLMLGAGAAWAVGGGLLNPSFEQGSGSSLDNWTVATYDYEADPGNRQEVYGPAATPVPASPVIRTGSASSKARTAL